MAVLKMSTETKNYANANGYYIKGYEFVDFELGEELVSLIAEDHDEDNDEYLCAHLLLQKFSLHKPNLNLHVPGC